MDAISDGSGSWHGSIDADSLADGVQALDLKMVPRNGDWSMLAKLEATDPGGFIGVETGDDIRSASSLSGSSIPGQELGSQSTSSDQSGLQRVMGVCQTAYQKSVDVAARTAHVGYQTQTLSPRLPDILLHVVQSNLGTQEDLVDADIWKRAARAEVANGPEADRTKMNQVLSRMDGIHQELATILAQPHICVKSVPTDEGPQTQVDVSRGFRRKTAATLVNFIRRAELHLDNAANGLKEDFESKSRFEPLYLNVVRLKATLPPTNFLQRVPHIDRMNNQQTDHLVASLQKLPSWLRSFRECYESIATTVSPKAASDDGAMAQKKTQRVA